MAKLRKGYVMNVGNGASAPETVPFTLDLALLVDCMRLDGDTVEGFDRNVCFVHIGDGLFRPTFLFRINDFHYLDKLPMP